MKPPARSRSLQRGFTLIEILVVVLIIGVLLSFATLSIGNRALGDKLDTEARRSEALFRLALDEASLKGYEIGYRLTTTRQEFLAIGPEGRWIPIPDGPLRPRLLPQPIELRLRIEGRPVPPAAEAEADEDSKAPPVQPQVLLMSSGEATAFTLDLSAPGLEQGWRLEADMLGSLKLSPQDRSP
ncbi:MAG TPA: type II secretion system minor pseudopilin GspH [Solimonas sp.]|nr:type II secretion system minor pseudopilin GspH [Solimonas sp.]